MTSPQVSSAALERAAPLGGLDEDLRALGQDVAAFVARLDHGLERDAVGGGAGRHAFGMSDGPAAELQDDVVAEQIEELVHLARMDAAGSDRHDLAQSRPVLLEEQAARGVDLVARLAQHVVEAKHGVAVALELAHDGARVQVIDSGEAQPFRDDAERDAMILLPRVGRVAGAMHVQEHVVAAGPATTWTGWRSSRSRGRS